MLKRLMTWLRKHRKPIAQPFVLPPGDHTMTCWGAGGGSGDASVTGQEDQPVTGTNGKTSDSPWIAPGPTVARINGIPVEPGKIYRLNLGPDVSADRVLEPLTDEDRTDARD